MGSARDNGSGGGFYTIRPANDRDREQIYQLRHDVYARELGQHPVNAEERLTDALDAYNLYFVVKSGDELAGFISITPPPSACGFDHFRQNHYSIDKYVTRDRLPFDIGEGTYEFRILTVAEGHRGSKITILLMYAALRWDMDHGGQRIIAIGRRDVMSLYRKTGMEPLDIEVQSGAVAFDCMHGNVEALRQYMMAHTDKFRQALGEVDWQLDVPFEPQANCYHGGAFFEAIGDQFDDLSRRDQVINGDVLDAWFDPSPKVLDALHEHLPWLLRTSPPVEE